MTDNRAICLLSQMYLPQFDDEEKEALTLAIKCIQENKEYRAEIISRTEEYNDMLEQRNKCEEKIERLEKILDKRCDKCPTTEIYLHSNKLLEKDVADARAELKKFKTMYVDKVAMMGARAFAEKLCKDRVSNDPVVIAVRSELKKEVE